MCPDQPPDVYVCWAHGLLFVVGAMCSPVYCLSPHILLPNHYFSCATCVSLVTLVCLPSLLVSVVLGWSVVFLRVRLTVQTVLCLPTYLFFPVGGFCCSLFYFIIKNPFLLHLSPCLISFLTHPDRTDQPDEDSAESATSNHGSRR